jgi:hypothetical protein
MKSFGKMSKISRWQLLNVGVLGKNRPKRLPQNQAVSWAKPLADPPALIGKAEIIRNGTTPETIGGTTIYA